MIWKYYDEDMKWYFNYPYLPTYVDRIQLTSTLKDGIPVFDKKVETKDGVLEYTVGNWQIDLTLLHTETSVNGDTLYDFLFDGNANKFLINYHFNDNCYFPGFFTSGDNSKNLTYSKGELSVTVQVYGALRELADSYLQPNQGTQETDIDYPLEGYLGYHFDDSTVLYQIHPNMTGGEIYSDRVGDSSVVFSRYMQTILGEETPWAEIPRWNTYKQLAKGIGFNFRIVMGQPSNFNRVRPMFGLEHLFLDDIENHSAVSYNVITHNEDFILNAKKWVFAGYRHFAYNDFQTYINGVLFNATELFSTDASDGINEPLHNVFIIRHDAYTDRLDYALVAPGSQNNVHSYNRESEVIGLELELYSNPAFGKFRAGSMSYASMVVADNYNHLPVQNYLANVYGRYLLGNKKKKRLTISFDGSQNLDLYRKLTLTDKDGTFSYYISAISGINLHEREAEIEVTQL